MVFKAICSDAYAIQLTISHGFILDQHIHGFFLVFVKIGVSYNSHSSTMHLLLGIFISHCNAALNLYPPVFYLVLVYRTLNNIRFPFTVLFRCQHSFQGVSSRSVFVQCHKTTFRLYDNYQRFYLGRKYYMLCNRNRGILVGFIYERFIRQYGSHLYFLLVPSIRTLGPNVQLIKQSYGSIARMNLGVYVVKSKPFTAIIWKSPN